MPEVHAKLSASGAKRWMNCPPSVRLEEGFKDKGSPYAKEGTLAHSLAELMINYNCGRLKKTEFNKQLKELSKDELYNQEMQDYIEDYVHNVWEFVNEAKAKCKDIEILTEQRLDFSEYVPDGFGTGDVVIISDGEIHIIDLKYGKGVEIFANDNPQLRLYGLGAISAYEMLYDFDKVKMTIIQPRLNNISSETMPVNFLKDWGKYTVKPLAELAIKGEGEFKTGDHCQFCKARATCRARAEENLELAKMEFVEPELLKDEEIGDVLRKADQLVHWVKDITEYALSEAVNNGKKWDGWKLVEGRSNRKYTDEIKVAEVLKEAGYDEAVLYEKKLYGITAMEKVVGKKKFSELLNDLVEKPTGKPTLVPESDKRPEINSTDAAKKDFEKEI